MKNIFFIFSFIIVGCGLVARQPIPYYQANSAGVSAGAGESSESDNTSSRSRRYRGGNDDDDDDDDDDHGHDIKDLHRIVGSNIDVTSLLNTVVFLFSLLGECDDQATGNTHKTCVIACLNANTNTQTKINCRKGCDSSNSCKTLSGVCSGVFQSSSTILTNHHCVEADINGYTEGGKYYYAIATAVENKSGQITTLKRVKWFDERADIALVELNQALSNAQKPDHGSLSELSLLDELFTIGAPSGLKWTASLGHLTNKNPPAGACTHCIFFSIPIGGGNSGGPVFNNQGHLVALIKATTRSYDNLSLGPHIDRIKHLINLDGSDDVTLLSYKNLQDNGMENRRFVLNGIKDFVIEIWND